MRNRWGCVFTLLLACAAGGFLLGRGHRPTGLHTYFVATRPASDLPPGDPSAAEPAVPSDEPERQAPRSPAGRAAGRAVIIIDDLGASRQACERFLRVPADLTFSFLPDAPLSQTLSREVAAQGRCVLLHLPMEPVDETVSLEPGTITTHMSASEIDAAVRRALAAVPEAVGVNNHMGSRATADEEVMRAALRPLLEHGLFFVDSRTTTRSVAARVAGQLKAPLLERDVFLDAEGARTAATVASNMQRLADLAQGTGLAVGIGHPFDTTAEGIERGLAYFDQAGIEIIAAGEAF